MSWKKLQLHAHRMGFEVALRTRRNTSGDYMPDLTPPQEGDGWLLIGNYEHIAGFWVKPVTENARRMSGVDVRRIMADSDPFVEDTGAYDDDFFAINEPFLAALKTLERDGE